MIWLTQSGEMLSDVGGQFANFGQFNISVNREVRPASDVTLETAISRCVTAKNASGLRSKYVKGLEAYLTMFARGREQMRVSEFGVAEIEAWFASRAEKPATRASNVGRLAALFSYAVRQNWMTENPCRRLERLRIDRKPPQILTPEQAEALLRYCEAKRPWALGFLTLAMLVGVRPSEIMKTGWDSVNLKDGTVTIDASASKVRRRRIIHPMPSALKWLTLAKEKKALLPVSHQSERRYQRYFRTVLGLYQWPQDVLRHTAASYWMSEWQDAGKVANELGNSAGILLTHYRQLVTRDAARQFWEVLPNSL